MFWISNSLTPCKPLIWMFIPNGSGYCGAPNIMYQSGKMYKPNRNKGPTIIKILAFFILLDLKIYKLSVVFGGLILFQFVIKAGRSWTQPALFNGDSIRIIHQVTI